MKKLFSSLALLTLLGLMLVPAMGVSAQGATQCKVRHTFDIGNEVNACKAGDVITFNGTNADKANCCLLDTVYTITDWTFIIVLGLAVIFILIAAFNFITAGGSPEKLVTARQYLIFGAIGILVAVLAKALPAIVKSIVGVT